MRTLEQSLEKIKSNIYWVKENGQFVDEWLRSEEYVTLDDLILKKEK